MLVQTLRAFRTHVRLRCLKRDEQQQRTLASIVVDGGGLSVTRICHVVESGPDRQQSTACREVAARCDASLAACRNGRCDAEGNFTCTWGSDDEIVLTASLARPSLHTLSGSGGRV